jgi:hypothetical protein
MIWLRANEGYFLNAGLVKRINEVQVRDGNDRLRCWRDNVRRETILVVGTQVYAIEWDYMKVVGKWEIEESRHVPSRVAVRISNRVAYAFTSTVGILRAELDALDGLNGLQGGVKKETKKVAWEMYDVYPPYRTLQETLHVTYVMLTFSGNCPHMLYVGQIMITGGFFVYVCNFSFAKFHIYR